MNFYFILKYIFFTGSNAFEDLISQDLEVYNIYKICDHLKYYM